MSAIYVNNNIDPFGVLVRKKPYSFKTRLGATSNLLVQCIVSSLFYYHSSSCVRCFRTTMEISVFSFLCYPGTLKYLCISALLYVFTLVYKINQIKNIDLVAQRSERPRN